MKKDRNCGGYPVYPNMGGMPMPLPIYPNMMQGPQMMPDYNMMPNNNSNCECSALKSKVNNLEQRVTALENVLNKSYSTNYNTNYNTSNYQMM